LRRIYQIIQLIEEIIPLGGITKERIKKTLNTFGLYRSARYVWIHKPSLHSLCQNEGYRIIGAPDGLPLPPDYLIYLVTISREVAWYLHSGVMCYQSMLYALKKQGIYVEDFEAILDFGCGCGRVTRYWKSIHGPHIYGTDYNPELIRWCKRKLGSVAQFQINQPNPPLDYSCNQFDLVYAISVFTHMSKQSQIAWIKELTRIVKPGKFLFITLHGQSRFFELEPEEQRLFKSGQMVVKQIGDPNSNNFGAYHPYEYVINYLAAGFEVIDFIPQGTRDANQDIYLLKKPG
jgi:ubiquinone/menaquinone biosynthesis C-methylase UbiE